MLVPGSNEYTNDLIGTACQEFVMRFPFGGLLVLGQHIIVREDNRIGTLCTNGRDIKYSPTYITAVYKKEGLRGVIFRICHEYLHIFFNHVDRAQHRDFKIWNYAIDIITNRLVEEILSTARDEWTTPKDGIQPKGWEKFETAELVYEELMKQKKKTGKDPLMPDPELYGEAFGGDDIEDSPFDTEAEKQEWQDGITEEICQADSVMEMNPAAPAMPGALRERLARVKEGRIPWSRLLTGRLLSDIGDNIATYSPPRKRTYPWLILPSYKGLKEKKLVLPIDVSASVGEHIISEFKGAVLPAARRAGEIHVIAFDNQIREVLVTKRPEEIRKFKFKTGSHSHTSVVEVFDYIAKVKPSGIACLTDGYIQLPSPVLTLFRKTIWCTPVGGRKQPWGHNFTMDVAW